MDDERIFAMVEHAVNQAVERLEKNRPLPPFALLLDSDGKIREIPCTETPEERCYESLLQRVRAETQMGDIDAFALTARVTIPEHYRPEAPQGIRVHIEEKAASQRKIAARLIYVPYDLFGAEGSDRRSAMLHTPISIGMPAEIFKG